VPCSDVIDKLVVIISELCAQGWKQCIRRDGKDRRNYATHKSATLSDVQGGRDALTILDFELVVEVFKVLKILDRHVFLRNKDK
jgi:hypothetical protein